MDKEAERFEMAVNFLHYQFAGSGECACGGVDRDSAAYAAAIIRNILAGNIIFENDTAGISHISRW